MFEKKYFDTLKKSIYDKISLCINDNTIDDIVEVDLYQSHIGDKFSSSFQKYYFETLSNENLVLSSTDFFHRFKKQYSLQGIDNEYLNRLEANKSEILNLIKTGDLVKLYFDNFRKASIKHGKEVKEKDLGSFFAKLVHTFKPDEFCALDNPIKNYFGLAKESFFMSFIIISSEYKRWAEDNKEIITSIRLRLLELDKNRIISQDALTDLKLLDLIFWSKANRTNSNQISIN